MDVLLEIGRVVTRRRDFALLGLPFALLARFLILFGTDLLRLLVEGELLEIGSEFGVRDEMRIVDGGRCLCERLGAGIRRAGSVYDRGVREEFLATFGRRILFPLTVKVGEVVALPCRVREARAASRVVSCQALVVEVETFEDGNGCSARVELVLELDEI